MATNNFRELPAVVNVQTLATVIDDTAMISLSVKPAAEDEFAAQPMTGAAFKAAIGGGLKSKTVKLTSANILAGDTVNFDIAVAGKIIVPQYAIFSYEAGAIAYDFETSIQILPVSII
jgi:hypothetical protein